jgi:hypothetical protein
MGKYQILWLNDDLRVNSSKFNLLDGLRREAEMKFNLSIQTCVIGSDFIEFANDKNQIWDAFIIDAIGKMQEEDCPKDIMGDILKDIDLIVKNQNILLYCMTEEIEEIAGSSLLQMLVNYNFVRTSIGKRFYDSESAKTIFQDVKDRLDNNGKLFQGFPEIEEIYLEIKRSKGENEATQAILDMLKWHFKYDETKDFESGVREVVRFLSDKLINLGFFNFKQNVKLKQPGDDHFSAVGGFCINMVEQDKKNDEYFLTDACRWNWEATAMNFLGNMANISHHSLQKDKGNTDDYNRFYRGMIFNAFVLFSKWYVRFNQICQQKGVVNNSWMFNPNYDNPKYHLPLSTTRTDYPGTIYPNKSNIGAWTIRPKTPIATLPYYIDVDPGADTNKFTKGRQVEFGLVPMPNSSNSYYATKIKLK